jgi:hypothetical protein
MWLRTVSVGLAILSLSACREYEIEFIGYDGGSGSTQSEGLIWPTGLRPDGTVIGLDARTKRLALRSATGAITLLSDSNASPVVAERRDIEDAKKASLPSLNGSEVSRAAHDMNSSGVIVGTSVWEDSAGNHQAAIAWFPGESHARDLNDFIPKGSNFKLLSAEYINDRNTILCLAYRGQDSGFRYSWVLVHGERPVAPANEPTPKSSPPKRNEPKE